MHPSNSLAILFALLVCCVGSANNLRVMNFNTMCELCDFKREAGPFKERLKNIADTIKRHDPDLISLQELQSKGHVKALSKLLDEIYLPIFKERTFFPATDATLFVRKDRFEVLETQGVWLGPKAPKFSFGWKFGVPRRFQWAHLIDKSTGFEFVFAGSHFDNHFANKDPSAVYAQTFFSRQTIPVLFAGDTNLRPEHNGYRVLINNTMTNTFDISENFQLFTDQAPILQDACGSGDRDNPWPACRIDHVLLSNNSPWRVKNWGSDLFHYYKGEKFVSDHRAVVVDLY